MISVMSNANHLLDDQRLMSCLLTLCAIFINVLVVLLIWLLDFFSIVLGICFAVLFAIQYLIYQFKQINDEIRLSYNKRNIYLLMKAIRNHKRIRKSLNKLNEFFRIFLYIIYYFLSLL